MGVTAKPPDGFVEAAERATAASFLLLQKLGPSCFLLMSPAESVKYKVTLGSPHQCSCNHSNQRAVSCTHVLHVILKILGVPTTLPLAWATNVTDLEVTQLLTYTETERERVSQATAKAERAQQRRGDFLKRKNKGGDSASSDAPPPPTREVMADDVCPICHDPLLDPQKPAAAKHNAWCQAGCGQSFHITCMFHWAEHRCGSLGEKQVTCPMCRTEWTPEQVAQLKAIQAKQQKQKAHHAGAICKKCRMIPIRGKLYACVLCGKLPIHFCEECYAHAGRPHQNHPFVCQEKPKGPLTMGPDRVDLLLEDFAPQEKFALNIYLARLLAEWEPSLERWKASQQSITLTGRADGRDTECTWACDASSPRNKGRLVRLRCGHVGHVSCAQRHFTDSLNCPTCDTALFAGIKALHDLASESQRRDTIQKASSDRRSQTKSKSQPQSREPSQRRGQGSGRHTSRINSREVDSGDIFSLQINGTSL